MTDRLYVRRDGRVVATLQRSGPKLWVNYCDDVVETSAGAPLLSCSLPVRTSRSDASAWARGLLPEGEHRRALAEAADVAASDTFGLLARYGRDIAGAFEIVEDPDEATRTPAAVSYTPGGLEDEVASLDTAPLGVHDDSELSLAGLQDKMTLVDAAGVWARPIHGYPSTHILKVDPYQYPGLVDAEAACLRLARAVGLTNITVERCRLVDRESLIVSRFDRTPDPSGAPRRIHQEDLLQALGIDPDTNRGRAKYQQRDGAAPTWWHAADLLDAYADDAPGELATLLRIVTFTTVIGNADCHAKNVAFILEHGRITLAPLYDTVPTALWPKLRGTAAMSVAGVWPMGDISVTNLASEAQRWRMKRATALAIVADILEELVEHAGEAQHDRVSKLVSANAKRLLAGAPNS